MQTDECVSVSWGLCDGSNSCKISTNALPESDVNAGESMSAPSAAHLQMHFSTVNSIR